MRAVERQLDALAPRCADVTLLQTVPGVGVITATALVALVADIRRFPSGRHFASFLGSDAERRVQCAAPAAGAISKQGDVYVRMLLTHGARSVVWHAKAAAQPTPLHTWALQTEHRRGAMSRRSPWRIKSGRDRLGRVGATTSLRGRSPTFLSA